ncbi:MAG: hypothetical protein U0T31_01320 [Chitinophagales bacterium]|nr:hypothetical protein [Chitinophagales bacterium]
MKKIIPILLLQLSVNLSKAQDYQQILLNINNYLKTFDNGYYGYLEIKDGYLYDRFKDGSNYCKSKMEDLDYAFEKEKNHKIDIACKGNNTCLYSTFTNQRYNSFSFSQATEFNTAPLISLFNDLISAYNKKDNTNNKDNSSDGLDNHPSNIDLTRGGTATSSVKKIPTGSYLSELKKLNDYLQTFDNGYYGFIEIKDGYFYDRFKSGEYSKTLIADLSKAEVETANQKVRIMCKSNSSCVYSTYTNSYHTQISFSQSTNFNTTILIDLLNNLLTAYKSTSESRFKQ